MLKSKHDSTLIIKKKKKPKILLSRITVKKIYLSQTRKQETLSDSEATSGKNNNVLLQSLCKNLHGSVKI